MATIPASPGTLAHTLRAIGGNLQELACTRAGIFAIELGEEARRGAEAFALAAAAIAFLHAALLLTAAVVVIAFWDTHRLAAAAAMALLYAAGAVAGIIRLRQRLAGMRDAFPATREEFRQDFANAKGYS
jgi:uncharacterized membrane protein YqjE